LCSEEFFWNGLFEGFTFEAMPYLPVSQAENNVNKKIGTALITDKETQVLIS
jgi:hypothetical protein